MKAMTTGQLCDWMQLHDWKHKDPLMQRLDFEVAETAQAHRAVLNRKVSPGLLAPSFRPLLFEVDETKVAKPRRKTRR